MGGGLMMDFEIHFKLRWTELQDNKAQFEKIFAHEKLS